MSTGLPETFTACARPAAAVTSVNDRRRRGGRRARPRTRLPASGHQVGAAERPQEAQPGRRDDASGHGGSWTRRGRRRAAAGTRRFSSSSLALALEAREHLQRFLAVVGQPEPAVDAGQDVVIRRSARRSSLIASFSADTASVQPSLALVGPRLLEPRPIGLRIELDGRLGAARSPCPAGRCGCSRRSGSRAPRRTCLCARRSGRWLSGSCATAPGSSPSASSAKPSASIASR